MTLTASSGTAISTLTINNMITVSNPEPVISGDAMSCINYTEIFSVEETAGSTYVWEVTGGNIIGPQGAEITVEWTNTGTAEIIVYETSSLDCEGISEPFPVSVELCTSIEDLNLGQVSIYPNPAIHELNINLGKGNMGQASLTIYNNSGILVSQSNLSPGIANHKIDISNLPAGLYFLRITSSIKEYSERFMVITENTGESDEKIKH